MTSENPYQSPETTSALEPSIDASGRIHSRFPTWRFWAMALLGGLTLLVLLLVLLTMEHHNRPGYRDTGWKTAIRIATVAAYLSWSASCLVILANWRAAPNETLHLQTTRGKLLLAAITMLAILDCLAVAAFFIAMFLPFLNPKESGRAIAGLAIGVFAVLICARVARDLWLDAMGRTKKIARDA
jgi:hypothetical protein